MIKMLYIFISVVFMIANGCSRVDDGMNFCLIGQSGQSVLDFEIDLELNSARSHAGEFRNISEKQDHFTIVFQPIIFMIPKHELDEGFVHSARFVDTQSEFKSVYVGNEFSGVEASSSRMADGVLVERNNSFYSYTTGEVLSQTLIYRRGIIEERTHVSC